MKQVYIIVGGLVTIIVIALGLGLVLSFPVKWLINGLFSESFILFIFGAKQISVWTAWGFTFLCSLLFKSVSNGEGK